MHGLALGQAELDLQQSGKFRRRLGLEASTDLNTGMPQSVGAGDVTIRYDHRTQVRHGISILGSQGKFQPFTWETLVGEGGSFSRSCVASYFVKCPVENAANNLAAHLGSDVSISVPTTDETLNHRLTEFRFLLHSLPICRTEGGHFQYALGKFYRRNPIWGL